MPRTTKSAKAIRLDSVADDFEVPADKIRKWNHLHGTALVPGRVLVIYKPAGSGGPEVASSEPQQCSGQGQGKPRTANQVHHDRQAAKYHKVKKGETLSSIAESYNTSVAALKRDNPKLAASLRAGDVLVIHK